MHFDELLHIELSSVPPFVLRLVASGSLLLLIALLLMLISARGSAALRHRIWGLSVVAVLLLPAVVPFLPEWRVGLLDRPDGSTPPAADREARVNQSGLPVAESRIAPQPAGDNRSRELAVGREPPAHRADRLEAGAVEHPGGGAPAPQTSSAGSPSAAADTPVVPPVQSARQRAGGPGWLLAGVWLIGAVFGACRIVRSLLTGRRLAVRSTAIHEHGCLSTADQLAQHFSIAQRPALIESAETVSPLCVGWLRPAIVLPAQWRQWSADHLRAALAHEMAHVARRDLAWQLLARLACALYWFHPLVWLAAWRMRVEREVACDDCVVSAGERPSRYARLLLALATELAGCRRAPTRGAVAMAGNRRVEGRIRAILHPGRRRSAVTRRAGWSLVIGAAISLLIVSIVSPLAPAQGNDESTSSQAGTRGASAETADADPDEPPSAESSESNAKRDGPAKADRPSEVRIAGRVLDEEGKPVAGARVTAIRRSSRPSLKSSADGRFQVEVPVKELSGLMLLATHDGGGRQAFASLPYQQEPIPPEGPIDLILKPAREIVATVRGENGRPIEEAHVNAVVLYRTVTDSTTNPAGQALLRVPRDAPLQYVYAYKPRVGLDYFVYRRPEEPPSNSYKLEPDHAGPLQFVLNGAHTVRVRAVDSKNRPLAGALVYPWYFEKPRKGGDLNLSGMESFVRARTDDEGRATFHIVPKDNLKKVIFRVRAQGYFAPERWMFDPNSPKPIITAKLVPLVTVRGRVARPDGRPAVGIEVRAAGNGHTLETFQETTHSDKRGTFELQLAPNMYYLFVAGNEKWASPPQTRVIRPEGLVEGIDEEIALELQPTTRVYGRATIGPDRKSLSDKRLSLVQEATPRYQDLPEERRLPKPEPKQMQRAIYPTLGRLARTDEQGRFEFLVGPGKYSMRGLVRSKTQKFEITDEKTFEVHLHAEGPDDATISGRVVLKDDPDRGVSKAKVDLVPTNTRANSFVPAITDAEGRFETRRALTELVVHAATEDRRLAGIVKVGVEDKAVTIPVGPKASATGRLVDEKTGKPLATREIRCAVRIELGDGVFMHRFGSSTKTDAKGKFTLKHIVPGWEYELNVVTNRDEEGRARGWRTVGSVKPERAEVVELGDVELPASR